MALIHLLALVDLILNTRFDSNVDSNFEVAVVMITQIVLNIVVVVLMYFFFKATFVFHAGLLSILIQDFKGALLSAPSNIAFMLFVRIRTLIILFTKGDAMLVWEDGLFYFAY